MTEIKEIKISKDVKSKFPQLCLYYLEISNINVKKQSDILKDLKKKLIEKWKGITIEQLGDEPKTTAYRKYFKRQQMDYKTIPPAVENLIIRAVSQGNFPSINSVVDSCNIISLQNLIPIGVFDKDKIEGELQMTFPGFGAKYTPIASAKKEINNQKILVLRDDEKIISIPCYRDSEYTKITEKTKNIIIVSIVVDGIEKSETDKAMIESKELLLKV